MQVEKNGQLIKSFLIPFPDRTTVKSFINLCHKTAIAYLRRKEVSFSYYDNFFGLSLEDIALDCIAGMFKQDHDGNYLEFTLYFKKIAPVEPLSDIDTFIYLRRLIFSQVNHHLFRINQTFDPVLGKIIRNIKLAIAKNTNLTTSTLFNQKIITLTNYNYSSDHKLIIPIEFLQIELFSDAIKTPDYSSILNKLYLILCVTTEYRKVIYLLDFAMLIRNAKLMNYEINENASGLEESSEMDVIRILNDTMLKVDYLLQNSYVKKEKMNSSEAEVYSTTVREIIQDVYLNSPPQMDHFYEHLRTHIKNLTKEDYNRSHRTKVEYLVKIAKQEMNKTLKKEFFSP